MTTEMLIPAKYKGDIDQLRRGHHGLHGLRHRLAWALAPECIRALTIAGLMVAPECIRALTIAGLMVATHPDEVMNALFEKSLTEYADQAAANEADEEARR